MATVTRRLRVATWNIHEGIPAEDGISGLQAHKQITTLLSDLEIDIIGLQEVNFGPSGESTTLAAITAETKLIHVAHNVLSESSFFHGDHAGVAIASRYPLSNLQRVAFENPRLTVELDGKIIGSHDKGMLSTSVVLPERILSVTSLHAFPFHIFKRCADDKEFRALWEKLGTDLDRISHGPTVVFGDFNTGDRSLLIRPGRVTLGRVIKELPTYKDKSYDDILCSADLTPESVQTVDNFSDHRLCVAELTWSASGHG